MKEQKDEHRKYYNKSGDEVPSCTTIVKLLDKPELVKWANYMGFKRINTTKLLESKAEYGTYCHKQVESYFNDGLISAKSNSDFLSSVEYRDVIYKIKIIDLYFQKLGIEVIRTELPIEGNEYGGTLDMLCYNRTKDCLMVFDVKTSKQVYQSHWVQIMGYCQLLEEKYNLHVDEIGVLLLSKPINSPELINIKPTKDCWREMYVFNALKELYYYLNAPEELIDKRMKENYHE